MNKLSIFFVVFSLFLTSFFSCQERSQSEQNSDLTENVDVFEEGEEQNRSLEIDQSNTGISLVGKWKLKERKMGVQVLQMLENDESTLEFTTDGMLISESDGFDPETYAFTQTDDLLSSDLWDTSQNIKRLSDDELVLVYQVDGVDIDHIYVRVQ